MKRKKSIIIFLSIVVALLIAIVGPMVFKKQKKSVDTVDAIKVSNKRSTMAKITTSPSPLIEDEATASTEDETAKAEEEVQANNETTSNNKSATNNNSNKSNNSNNNNNNNNVGKVNVNPSQKPPQKNESLIARIEAKIAENRADISNNDLYDFRRIFYSLNIGYIASKATDGFDSDEQQELNQYLLKTVSSADYSRSRQLLNEYFYLMEDI